MHDDQLIKLINISKTYTLGNQEIKALKKVNLSIQSGDFLVIAGTSGSGKSTLLNLISLIDSPSSGDLLFGGQNIDDFNDNRITGFRNDKIGIVFQNYNLVPVLSALENVTFPLNIQKVPKKETLERAHAILKEVGLEKFTHHKPANLSGGQRQRVAIARALVTEPEIVIADEPTAALDSKTGREVVDLMKKMNLQKSTTFVFSTHDPKIINMVDQVIQLEDGGILN